jgi:membrane complex biogenesis BtpA family protein
MLKDAESLQKGGVHGIMMENFGDVPFSPGRVESETIALMTSLACRLKDALDLPLGINVLRNDAESALAIAIAAKADFIRVNVLCGARVTDQGLIQGVAYNLLRMRSRLGANDIAIMADVDVKHSAALAERSLKDEVEDTVKRGLADGVIVSGAGTGKAVDPSKLQSVAKSAGHAPVILGSGVSAANIKSLMPHAWGFIVGTSLKVNGDVSQPVDVARVKKLMKAMS